MSRREDLHALGATAQASLSSGVAFWDLSAGLRHAGLGEEWSPFIRGGLRLGHPDDHPSVAENPPSDVTSEVAREISYGRSVVMHEWRHVLDLLSTGLGQIRLREGVVLARQTMQAMRALQGRREPVPFPAVRGWDGAPDGWDGYVRDAQEFYRGWASWFAETAGDPRQLTLRYLFEAPAVLTQYAYLESVDVELARSWEKNEVLMKHQRAYSALLLSFDSERDRFYREFTPRQRARLITGMCWMALSSGRPKGKPLSDGIFPVTYYYELNGRMLARPSVEASIDWILDVATELAEDWGLVAPRDLWRVQVDDTEAYIESLDPSDTARTLCEPILAAMHSMWDIVEQNPESIMDPFECVTRLLSDRGFPSLPLHIHDGKGWNLWRSGTEGKDETIKWAVVGQFELIARVLVRGFVGSGAIDTFQREMVAQLRSGGVGGFDPIDMRDHRLQ